MQETLQEMNTVSCDMSKATNHFTQQLLSSVGITTFVLPHCKETASENPFEGYQWGADETEASGQERCKSILEAALLPWELNGRQVGLFDVRTRTLPILECNRYRSSGSSDLAIGDLESMSERANKDLCFHFAVALIELKTAKAELKQNQLLLQLCSLAQSSNVRTGVVVLGTDCCEKWRLVHFSSNNTVAIQSYSCGWKCLEDLKSLVGSGDDRWRKMQESVPSIPEHEDDALVGGIEMESREQFISDAQLAKFARKLERLYPENNDGVSSGYEEQPKGPPAMIYI